METLLKWIGGAVVAGLAVYGAWSFVNNYTTLTDAGLVNNVYQRR